MRKRIICCVVLLLAVLAFIWGNSMLSATPSNELSDAVRMSLTAFLHKIGLSRLLPYMTSKVVRKLAHATEFALLGFISLLTVKARGKQMREKWTAVLLLGLGTAVIDETIQMFTARSSKLTDVWIDFGGFLLGICVAAFLLLLAKGVLRLIRFAKEKRQTQ